MALNYQYLNTTPSIKFPTCKASHTSLYQNRSAVETHVPSPCTAVVISELNIRSNALSHQASIEDIHYCQSCSHLHWNIKLKNKAIRLLSTETCSLPEFETTRLHLNV